MFNIAKRIINKVITAILFRILTFFFLFDFRVLRTTLTTPRHQPINETDSTNWSRWKRLQPAVADVAVAARYVVGPAGIPTTLTRRVRSLTRRGLVTRVADLKRDEGLQEMDYRITRFPSNRRIELGLRRHVCRHMSTVRRIWTIDDCCGSLWRLGRINRNSLCGFRQQKRIRRQFYQSFFKQILGYF